MRTIYIGMEYLLFCNWSSTQCPLIIGCALIVVVCCDKWQLYTTPLIQTTIGSIDMGKGTRYMKNCHSLYLITSTAEFFSKWKVSHIFAIIEDLMATHCSERFLVEFFAYHWKLKFTSCWAFTMDHVLFCTVVNGYESLTI